MTEREGYLWGALFVGTAAAVAAGIVLEPSITVVAIVVLALFVIAQKADFQLPALFLSAVAALLVGYATLGRGFAYFGVAPLFVGEAVLALGILGFLTRPGARRQMRASIEPLFWVIGAYFVWGLAVTIPAIPEFGIVALRDAVVWGYAIFAILVYAFVMYSGVFKRAVVGYSLLLPWFLVWVPISLWLTRFSRGWGLYVPGSPEIPLIGLKAGDMAVHLAGAAIFLVLGLHAFGRRSTDPTLSMKEWMWWGLWLGGFVTAASTNRGGMLSVLVAGSIAMALRPGARWLKGAFVALLIGGMFVMMNVEIETGHVRKVSPQQIIANMASIVGDSEREGLRGTRRWREEWWSDIIDYTVYGPHFWTGKGPGINLAIDDGIASGRSREAAVLRSPHNGHLTILARFGVPGFLLWLSVNGLFAINLLRACLLARRFGSEWWARVDLWLIAYWSAFFVNTTFDVFLEGPQGGIFFWSLVGFGMAAIEIQRRSFAAAARVPREYARARHPGPPVRHLHKS